MANASMDSKSLKYVCMCVDKLILQPRNSSQEGSKYMDIFRSFWGLISLVFKTKIHCSTGIKSRHFLDSFFHVIPCE